MERIQNKDVFQNGVLKGSFKAYYDVLTIKL